MYAGGRRTGDVHSVRSGKIHGLPSTEIHAFLTTIVRDLFKRQRNAVLSMCMSISKTISTALFISSPTALGVDRSVATVLGASSSLADPEFTW
jgi:hypothetical protein